MDLMKWKRGVFTVSEHDTSSSESCSPSTSCTFVSLRSCFSSYTNFKQLEMFIHPWLVVASEEEDIQVAEEPSKESEMARPSSSSMLRQLSCAERVKNIFFDNEKGRLDASNKSAIMNSMLTPSPSSFSSTNFLNSPFHFSHFRSLLPLNEVSKEKWNAYWSSFSEICSEHVDFLMDQFSSPSFEPSSGPNTTCGFLSGNSAPRSVQVWVQCRDSSNGSILRNSNSNTVSGAHLESVCEKMYKNVLLSMIVFYARQCGAVELVEHEEEGKKKKLARNPESTKSERQEDSTFCSLPWLLCSVHFTTHAAAIMFFLWLNSSSDISLLFEGFRSDLVAFFGWKDHRKRWWETVDVEPKTKEVFDPFPCFMKIPSYFASCSFFSSLMQSSASILTIPSLLLGFNIFFPTIFVDRLFCGMMQAKEVQFLKTSKSFLITFNSVACARSALHILQYSLYSIFGLSLIPVEST